VPWRPYELTTKGEVAVSSLGKDWLNDRIPDYQIIMPPDGLPYDEAKKRKMTHMQYWTGRLAQDYMAMWPEWDNAEVLGPDPDDKQLSTHKRVCYFDNSFSTII